MIWKVPSKTCTTNPQMWNQIHHFKFYEKVYLLIIRSRSPHVSHTVDEKCNVESDGVAQIEINPKRLEQRLPHVEVRNQNRNGNRQQRVQGEVELLLPHYDAVSFQVCHIYLKAKTMTHQSSYTPKVQIVTIVSPSSMSYSKNQIQLCYDSENSNIFFARSQFAVNYASRCKNMGIVASHHTLYRDFLQQISIQLYRFST